MGEGEVPFPGSSALPVTTPTWHGATLLASLRLIEGDGEQGGTKGLIAVGTDLLSGDAAREDVICGASPHEALALSSKWSSSSTRERPIGAGVVAAFSWVDVSEEGHDLPGTFF